MTRMMRELVQVQGGFKPSVQLPDDFWDEELNRHFVESFIPNEDILNIFKSIRDSLQAGAEDRARLFAGTFGTGKSDLMLMVANYLTRSADDPLLSPFFERLHRLDHARAESIYQARLNKPPFLLVLLQTEGANTFSSFVINGLAQSLDQSGLKQLLGKTYYQSALDVIDGWEQNYPDYIKRVNDELEQNYGRTLTRLKNELQGTRGDSSLELFREVVQKVMGMKFEPAAEVRRPADAFMEVAQKLVDNRQYSGLIVIADEFTHLLHKLAEAPGAADAKAIDNLAEKAVRSGQHQLHFYVVSLESFASIKSSSQSSQLALERTGGRFKEYSLKSQNTEELISAAVGKLVSPESFFAGASSQFDDLLNLAMRMWGEQATARKDRDWLTKIVVQGCFPLHPLTTFCLPRLNQVLAQNQRTMFRFIWDEAEGLSRFIATATVEPDNGWIPLFSLDRLFDYFESNLNEKRLELLLSYQDARRKLSSQQIETGLEGRLLRALVVLEVADQRADVEIVRHAVGLPPNKMVEIKAALGELERSSAAFSTQAGDYQLVKLGGVNPNELKRAIEKNAQNIERPLENLNLHHKPNDIPAERFNSDRGTSRELTARFVSLAMLDSPATLTQYLQQSDGLLWYVVSSSEYELDQARAKALQLTRQKPRLVIAVSRTPTDLLVRFQQKRALESLRVGSDYKSTLHQDLLSDTGQIGKDYVETFRKTRQAFEQPQNFDWYRGGRTINVTMPAHTSNLASTVMSEVFSATPAHKTQQHLKATGNVSKEALNHILQSPFKLPVRKKGKKTAVEAVLIDGAGELGLIQHEKTEQGFEVYNICPPTAQQRDSLKVWLLLQDELRKGTTWADIVRTLSIPPYGLYSSVLQLFLATFYRYNQDYLEIFSTANIDGIPLVITGDIINKITETPGNYVLRYQPLSEEQRRFLHGLVDRALYPGRPIHLQRGETASLRNRVAQLLRRWVGDHVSVIARQATANELSSVLEETPAEIVETAVALMQVAMQPQEAATAKALLDDLPSKVGLVAGSSTWSDQQLDQAFAYLESACRTLTGFEKAFKRHIAGQIGEYFGLTESSNNWNDTLSAAVDWRKNVVSRVRLSDLGGVPVSRDLLLALDDEPDNFQQVFLIRLPHNWHFGAFEQWRTLDVRDKYLAQLKQAKEAIEARATELGVLPPEPPKSEKPATGGEEPPQPPGEKPTVVVIDEPPLLPPIVVNPPIKPTLVPPEPPVNQTSLGGVEKPVTTPPVKTQDAIDETFVQIVKIINQLPPTQQRLLWQRLKDEYDPE